MTRQALETVAEEQSRSPALVVSHELEDVVLLRGLGIAATLATGLDQCHRGGLQGLKQALDWSDESGDRVDLMLCNCSLAACAKSTTDWQDVQRRIRAIQRLGLEPQVYLWTPTSPQLEDLRLLQELGDTKWLRASWSRPWPMLMTRCTSLNGVPSCRLCRGPRRLRREA